MPSPIFYRLMHVGRSLHVLAPRVVLTTWAAVGCLGTVAKFCHACSVVVVYQMDITTFDGTGFV